MKVLHFNASLKGGAAIAAQRIFDAVLHYEPDMYFYSLQPSSNKQFRIMPAFASDGANSSILARIKWSLFYRSLGSITAGKLTKYEKFTPATLPINTPMPTEQGVPDLIHMHWTSEMVDYASFFGSVPDNIPIIWTCHDMNPYTGGCHYTWGCNKFEHQCGACPQLATSKPHDAATKTQRDKANALRNKKIHMVGNSYWVEDEARKSTVFTNAASFQTIHYPIDTEVFTPLDKAEAKRILGIPTDALVVSFGAERFDNQRKGFALLLKALEIVYAQHPQLQCLVFGGGQGNNEHVQMPPMLYMGFVESGILQRIVYSASDVFVIPSQQEAFGQTALEAMSCATAVVGFDTGGIPDMIKPGKTGLLAENGNHEALATAIMHLLANPLERNAIATRAREYAVENFNKRRQGRLYHELYKKALGQ